MQTQSHLQGRLLGEEGVRRAGSSAGSAQDKGNAVNNGSEAGASAGEHGAWTAEYEVSQVPDVGRQEREVETVRQSL